MKRSAECDPDPSHVRESRSGATTPTFLYHPAKGARIFELAPGEAPPPGWHDTPAAFATRTEAQGGRGTPRKITLSKKGARRRPVKVDSGRGPGRDAAGPQ